MADELPSFGAQFDAMFREAIKDIRQTMNEVMFNQHEHAPEMGTPMNPTPQMEHNDLMGKTNSYDDMLDQYAARGNVHGQEQDKGMER